MRNEMWNETKSRRNVTKRNNFLGIDRTKIKLEKMRNYPLNVEKDISLFFI